jgi:D-alanyl-D-alanine carboxypeptidase
MLRSGNDAAMTIAYNVFGYNRFIQEMNTKAMILGMTNTTYENPHGLNDDSYNYSTAKDLSKLMRYAIQNEEFLKITRTNKYNNWYNKNELLNEYKYLISGKTGYTKKSGKVYVSSAIKKNKKLIISTIDENNKYELHKQLYEKYFDEYKKYKVLNQYTFSFKEKTNEKIHYYIRKDFDMLIKENELNDLKIKVDTQNEAVKIYIKDKLIHSQRLYKMEYKNKVNIIKQILSFFGL